jgi:hypothetical protein
MGSLWSMDNRGKVKPSRKLASFFIFTIRLDGYRMVLGW